MEQLTFENVWGEKSPALIEEISNKWKSLGVIPPNESPEKRARQVVFLIRNEKRGIVGISTAYNLRVEQLGNHLLAFRSLLDPQYRIPGLFIKLVHSSFDYLESIHHTLEPKPIGLIAEIESPNLLKLRDAVTSTGFVFIGYSARKLPLRVKYFKGAKF